MYFPSSKVIEECSGMIKITFRKWRFHPARNIIQLTRRMIIMRIFSQLRINLDSAETKRLRTTISPKKYRRNNSLIINLCLRGLQMRKIHQNVGVRSQPCKHQGKTLISRWVDMRWRWTKNFAIFLSNPAPTIFSTKTVSRFEST